MESSSHRTNRRRHKENYITGKHATIQTVINELGSNQYLDKFGSIPAYPQPVEFHVTKVKHVTGNTGVYGIMEKGGFLPGQDKRGLSWWSLEVEDDDITAAEERFLQSLFPNRTEAQAEKQKPFLKEFTTSPAFLKSSRYGNFKFTFGLKELLHEYSRQMCNGEKPILRVYETLFYKQEIVHSVIAHSPDTHDFDQFQIFQDGGRAFEDGIIVWRPEAMSETHRYELITKKEENTVEAMNVWHPQFYVWDHLTLAFHCNPRRLLHFGKEKLADSLSACEIGKPALAAICSQADQIVAQIKRKYETDKNMSAVNN
ncbi:uncharacterized protein LOC118770588 [Megalops cyprinoides]|uniref:uncharacterized protein LOC118770588 n=1 Tax=Megalops cyprinoides TaxID=118141 RepID=UPI00186461EF|nr:uncharacterized protein LOC118770588 [Megalops cyprinoides]